MAIDDESDKGYSASWSLSAKPCDSCKSASALLFCRADSAFLCFNCDAKVHGANKLASRHERVWMCEVCEQAPANVTYEIDAATLCVTCDRDIHSANPLAWRHKRIPVVSIYESATPAMKSDSSDDDDDRNDKEEDNDTCRAEAEAASWLLPNLAKLMETPDLKSGDYFFSDVDPYLDLDYGSSMETRYHHQNNANADSVVPVHTKPPPPPLMNTFDRCFDMGFSIIQSVSSSLLDIGVVPDGNNNAVSDITNPFGRKGGVDASGGNHGTRAGGKGRGGQVRANTAKVSAQGNASQGESIDAVKNGLNGLSSE
uniref:B box-type domain-containing protein n=1 Tax=Nelumbo nucifera TaxID=4432 RepID=A0A822ZJV7_NELNU|nr:TPA_asm: hypothetical protein HUJ06_003642 [Nelumbo nucifera]